MPAAIPLIVSAAATYAGATAMTAAMLTLGASLVVGAYEQNKSKKAARSAYEASLTDRALVVRSPMATRTIAYGRTILTQCPLVWANTRGDKSEYLDLIIALAGHEIDAIEAIQFDDVNIGALTSDGYVTAGKFVKLGAQRETRSTSFVVTEFPTQVVTLDDDPATGSIWAGSNSGTDQDSILILPISVSGRQVTITTNEALAGLEFGVYYNLISVDPVVRIVSKLGAPDQTAIQELIDASGGAWTAEHRGRGVPYLWVQLRFDPDLFPTGIPNVGVISRNKKCFDPRSGQTVWTRNPALHALDYLRDRLGFNCQDWEIDMSAAIAAANVCDETVDIEGGSQLRYQGDGILSTDADKLENLGLLMSAMGGTAVYSQGTWKIFAGAYRQPTIELTADDLTDIAPLGVQSRVERKDLFNAVRGTYIDPTKSWQPTDFPMVTNATYEAEDNGEQIVADIQLPMTTDVTMAQRLAKRKLEDHRQALTGSMPFNLRAYRLQPEDTFRLTIARYGWDRKVFRVIDRAFSPEKGIALTFKETSPAIDDWNMGEATIIDPAPNTNLPDPFFVPEIGQIALSSGDDTTLIQQDGTAVPRLRATWTPVTYAPLAEGGDIQVEAFVQDQDDPVISLLVGGGESLVYLAPVRTGMPYRVRVRGMTRIGVRGRWSYSDWHLVAGKVQPPPAITALTAAPLTQGIALAWTFPSGLMDIGRTEIWYSQTPNRADAIKLSDFAYSQNTHRMMGLAFGVSLWFWARLVDRSGNIGPYFPAGAGVNGQTSTDPSEILDAIAGQIGRTELAQEMVEEIDRIPEIDRALLEQAEALEHQSDLIVEGQEQAAADLLAEAHERLDLQEQMEDALQEHADQISDATSAIAVETAQRITAVAGVAASAAANATAISTETALRVQAVGLVAADVTAHAALIAGNTDAIEAETEAREDALQQEAIDRAAAISITSGALGARIDALSAEVSSILGIDEYSPTDTYEVGDQVAYADKLWRALGTTTGNAPPDPEYWEKIGDYTSLGEVVADLSSRVTTVETVTAGQAVRLSSVEVQSASQAVAISTLETASLDHASRLVIVEAASGDQSGRIVTLEDATAAHASRLTIVEASAASSAGKVSTLETASADHAARLVLVETASETHSSQITTLSETQADQAQQLTQLETSSSESTGRILLLETTVAGHAARLSVVEAVSADSAAKVSVLEEATDSLALQVSTLEASAGENDGLFTEIRRVAADHALALTRLAVADGQAASQITDILDVQATQATRIGLVETTAGNAITRVSAVETTTAAHATRLSTVEAGVGSNTSAIGVLQTASAAQASLLSTLSTTVGTQGSDISELLTTTVSQASAITALQTTAGGLGTRLTTVETTTATQGTRIGTLETQGASTVSRVSTLETTTVTQALRLTALETTSGTSTGRLSVLETTAAAHAARLVTLEARSGDAAASITTLLETTDTLALQVSTLEASAGENDGLFTEIRQVAADHALALTRLAVTDGQTASQIVDILDVQATQATRIGTVETAATALTNRVTTVESTTAAHASRLTAVESVASNAAGRVSTLETASAAQAARLTTVEASAASSASKVSVLETASASQASRLVALETTSGTQASAITALQSVNATQATAITALQTSTSSLTTRVGTVETTTATQGTRLTTVEGTATTTAGKVTVLETASALHATRISTVEARADGLDASVLSEQEARIEGDAQIATLLFGTNAGDTDWNAGDPGNNAGTRTLMSSITDGDLANAIRIDQVQAGFETSLAAVETAATATATDVSAIASEVTTVTAQVGETTAAVQTVAQAQVDLNGALSAMYAVKVGITADGRYYQAGIGAGVENTPEGMQSEVYALADRFAFINLVNGVITTPFVIQGGQTLINQALIGNGWITNAMIGEEIRSTATNSNGDPIWLLNKNGTFQINGNGSDRLVVNSSSVRVYSSNVLVVELGLLT